MTDSPGTQSHVATPNDSKNHNYKIPSLTENLTKSTALCSLSRFLAFPHKQEFSSSHKITGTVLVRKTLRWKIAVPQADTAGADPPSCSRQALRGSCKDQNLLLVFTAQLLYKGTDHSHDTLHHILHKTQLISFHHTGIFTEIEGHIKVTSSRHKNHHSSLIFICSSPQQPPALELTSVHQGQYLQVAWVPLHDTEHSFPRGYTFL